MRQELLKPTAGSWAPVGQRRGIPMAVAPEAAKFGRQIRYADRRGIPYVWFGAGEADEVKDIRSGDQVPADPATWEPPAEDLHPRVVPGA